MDRPSRSRPAAVAGLGAGGSLGAAALCILALGAATVAYKQREAPNVGDRDGGSVTLAEPRRSAPRAEPEPIDRERVPRVRVAAARDRPAVPRRSRDRSRARRTVTVVRRARPVLPRPPATPPPAPTPPPPPQPPPSPPPTLVRGHVEAVARQARATGDSAAATASQVSPEAGRLVQDASDTAVTAVEDVAAMLP